MDHRKLLNIELGRVDASAYRDLPDSGFVVVLDNIRSAHNVGSAFRTCDSFKADCLWLCGICAVPPSAEIRKSALGAEESVPWRYSSRTLDVVEGLRKEGYSIVSVEQAVGSVSLEDFVPDFWNPGTGSGRRYAFIFGNEVDGVSQEVIDASDMVVEIPQFGTKHSLNVSVSIGVILWHFVELKLKNSK
ncbi:MAG: RNA methyltransferase [Bacteroidales bacterium]|nr:RNA methyltransferase [Bacteroidales bacterium]